MMMDIKQFIVDKKSLIDSYNAGFDCGKNGANTKNCHFSFFASETLTKAWEEGKKKGEIARMKGR